MIGYLKGKVLQNLDGKMIVVVSSAMGTDLGGIGYSVTVPANGDYLSLLVGSTVELYIYTHVREDALDLYGFASQTDKELFLTLMGVNGIGPKLALGILSAAPADALIGAILDGDKVFLKNLPGVGKKTAERVVLELADTIRKKFGAEPAVAAKGGAYHSGAHSRDSAIVRDAKAGLMSLGYREPEAAQMLNRAIAAFEDEPSRPNSTEELIRSALQGGN